MLKDWFAHGRICSETTYSPHAFVTGGGVRWWHELEHDLLLAQKRGKMDIVTEYSLKVFLKQINTYWWVVVLHKGLSLPERVMRYIGHYIKWPPLLEHAIHSMDDGTI